MITGLRSAVICRRLEITAEGELNLYGLAADTLTAAVRPGILFPALALQVDTDGNATSGVATLRADRYEEAFPFSSPAGVRVTNLLLELALPVIVEGRLTVEVADGAKARKPYRVSWNLVFDALAATDMDPAAEANVLARVAEHTAAQRRSQRHGVFTKDIASEQRKA